MSGGYLKDSALDVCQYFIGGPGQAPKQVTALGNHSLTGNIPASTAKTLQMFLVGTEVSLTGGELAEAHDSPRPPWRPRRRHQPQTFPDDFGWAPSERPNELLQYPRLVRT